MYQKYFKRLVDVLCSLAAIIVFSWLYIIVAILVRIKLGSPVIFKQARPGKDEKIFNVKVESIRTINVKPKKRRVGRYTGLTNRTKKAIVTLAEGQTIDLG